MKKEGLIAVLAVVALMLRSAAGETLSEPVMISLPPDRNRCWETVFTNEVALTWDWDWVTDSAVSAELRIDGMNGGMITNITAPTTSLIWRPFEGESPSREDAYTLTLTYRDAANGAVGSLVSRLSVVKGAFGHAYVDPVPASKTWSTVRYNVVIPYAADWAEETKTASSGQLVIAKVAGPVRTNLLAASSGYYGWRIKPSDWGAGTFDLTLSFPDMATNVWQATLTRAAEGTVILLK